MSPSERRVAFARQRPYVASFLLGSCMAVVAWGALWIVGSHVQGKDFALLLGLGLFVVGPLLVVRAHREQKARQTSGFSRLPVALRETASVFFCLAPLITFGVMTPLCLSYAASFLQRPGLRKLAWLGWGLMLACFGLVNHANEGSAAQAAGVWIGALNALLGTGICFLYRRQLTAAE